MKTDIDDIKKHCVVFTDFNASVAKRIGILVGKGMFPLPAAIACGVIERVWNEWWKRGVEDLSAYKNTEYSRLVVSIEAREAQLEAEIVKSYFKGAKIKPHDCAKFLAQRFPTRWNPNTPAAGTGNQQVVNIQVVKYQLPAIQTKKPKATVQQLPQHSNSSTQTVRRPKLPASADGGFVPKHKNISGETVVYRPKDITL